MPGLSSSRSLGFAAWALFAATLLFTLIQLCLAGLLFLRLHFTKAEVIKFENREGVRTPIVELQDNNGRYVSVPLVGFFAKVKPGQRLEVPFDPASPSSVNASVIDFLPLPVGSLLLTFILLLIASRVMPRSMLMYALRGGGRVHQAPPRQVASKPRAAPPGKGSNGSSIAANAGKSAPPAAKEDRVQTNFDATKSFGVIQSLINDRDVSDIIIASYQSIKIRKFNRVEGTSIQFESEASYRQFVEFMLLVAGTSYSIAKPIADGMVTSEIRIHAIHPVLCQDGPYVTLRMNRHKTIQTNKLIESGMLPREMLSALEELVRSGNTMLISGEVGTGKTTLLRALASLIEQHESILVIEDTPELQIGHPNVRYIHTREANVAGHGQVRPSECIRAGMRMSMDRIIFGEIRDSEAAEAFLDVSVSGHPGLSTVHARSASDTLGRIELLMARQQPGLDRIVVREQVAAAVQIIIHLIVCRETGMRRVSQIVKLEPNPSKGADKEILFQYKAVAGSPAWERKSSAKQFEAGAGA